MKASKILKRALALLLGLIVYFSVASPTEAYASPDANTDPWIITVPAEITAGTTDPVNDKVTISGKWEASKTVTVTSDAEIIMTCATIADSEVTAKVNFPADGLHTLSKHGAAEPVEQGISVEAPNVLFGEWTGTINYQVNIEDFAPQKITITQPTKTQYIEEQTFDPAGMQLKVVYLNGAEETIDVATNAAVTLPTAPLKYSDKSVTVGYGGNNYEVPVNVLPKLVRLETPGYQSTYIEGDTLNLVVNAIYQQDGVEQTPTPVTDYTFNRDINTPLLVSDSGTITVNYVDEDNQPATTDIAITVNPKLKSIDVTGGNNYVEGDHFEPTSVVVTYIENGEENTKTVENYTISPSGTLTTADDKVTLTYTEYDQSVEQDVPVTVVPKLIALEATNYQNTYAVGDKFDPDGMIVTVSYTENGQVKTKTVENYTISPSTSTALTTANTKVTITYEEYGQTVTADATITVKSLMLLDLTVSGDFKKEYYEGNAFDKTNMVVTVKYRQNGTEQTKIVENYTISPSGTLTTADNKVTITYVEDGQTLTEDVPITVTIPPVPTLAAERTWLTASGYDYNVINTITTVNIVKSYTPSGNVTHSWPAAVDGDGDGELDSDIMCYLEGTKLTIAGNGRERINANANSKGAFSYFPGATSITGLDILDTSNVTSMYNMFTACRSLTSLDLSSFNTDNVTNMIGMFSNCESLTSLNVSSFNTEKVTSFLATFSGCKKLTSLDLRHFNTENVGNMTDTFLSCTALKSLDISTWDTRNVGSFQRMFKGCKALTTLDLSSFVGSSAIHTNSMFDSCSNLTSVDLSSFGAVSLQNSSRMFFECKKLTTIYASAAMSVSQSSNGMFQNSGSIVGGQGTKYSQTYMDATYARIDDPDNGQPGYFTYKAPRS